MNLETFFAGNMESQDVQSLLRTIKYQDSGDYAEIHDGAFVVLGDLILNDPYNLASAIPPTSGVLDDNTYVATAPAALTDKVVVVDLSEVSNGVIANNNYRIGIKQFGLRTPAAMPARVRIMKPYDVFWLNEDCFTAEPTLGEYAVLTVADTHLTPAAAAPIAGNFGVQIMSTRDHTAGNNSISTLYLCQVI